MKVTFWGTHGSIPASLTAVDIRRKLRHALRAALDAGLQGDDDLDGFISGLPFWSQGTYGTNTTCVQVAGGIGREAVLCDAGTGLRDYGVWLKRHGLVEQGRTYHILMSHLHWDHIQGFPFFIPAFVPGNRIIIHSYHTETEAAFRNQMQGPCFPVPFDALPARITFDTRPPLTPFEIDGIRITAFEQNHPGTSYGYRFEKANRSVVFSSDSEHKADAYEPDYPYLDFIRDADLLIFDAQYSLADAKLFKAEWGHSSNAMAVELATRAHVKRLALCHHEPTSLDESLDAFLQSTRRWREEYLRQVNLPRDASPLPEDIFLAYDGLVIEW